MISPLHPEESLDSIIEELNLNCWWCDGKCQNQLNHRFSAIMFASWLFESCTWLLPTIFTYEYPFMVRIIACNNVCNFCVNIADFCQFMNNSWIFWSEIKDSCRMQKAICSSCKGSCLGIRFILCSIPSFWTDEQCLEIRQKCLTLNFHNKKVTFK